MILFLLLPLLVFSQTLSPCVPFGLRLSLGEYYSQKGSANTTQIYVTFNTLGNCTGTAHWGNLNQYSPFSCSSQYLSFSWEAPPSFSTTVYTCPITNIDFNSISLYTVSTLDSNNTELIYDNKNISVNLDDWNSPDETNFLVFGDWSYEPLNSSSQPAYSPITNCLNIVDTFFNGRVDGIIFLGDMAYNLSSNNGTNYVEFLLMIEPYSSAWPFMATPGAIDQQDPNDQLLFNSSFNYPYMDDNYYYNFTYGEFTFISFNTYPVVTNQSNGQEILSQIIQELNSSLQNSPTSYVIPFSHYPFFCSYSNASYCQTNNQTLWPLQNLMVNSGKVPVYLSSYIHTYERSYPIQSSGRLTSTNNALYTQPQPPIYVIEGAAGNSQSLITSSYSLKYFTASSVVNTGFGILAMNSLGDVLYSHFNALNCSTTDTFEITTTISPSNSSGFPVWLIVLLVLMGLSLIGGSIWFFVVKKRRSVRNMSAGELQSYYQSMELN